LAGSTPIGPDISYRNVWHRKQGDPKYHHNVDHPVLQDFVATMREHASDTAAYDAFTQ
jgi:hypothetical protein